MEQITSEHNTKLKLVNSLKQKKYRDQTGLFIVEGIRLSEEVLAANWQIEFALCSESADQPRLSNLLTRLNEAGIAVCCTKEKLYAKAADTLASQGILLVVRQQKTPLAALQQREDKAPFWIIIEAVQDPGNMGTILRTANAAGCTGAIVLAGAADIFSPKTVRATMGALFQLPVAADIGLEELKKFADKYQLRLLGTALDKTAKSCFAVDYRGAVAIALGNEGNGLSKELLGYCQEKVFIPMKDNAESLNVAAAAAVVIYEGFRQREFSL